MAWHWGQSGQMLRRYRIKYPVLALLTIALALLATVAPARSRIAPARVEGTADVAVERSQFILEKLAQQQKATPSQNDRAAAEQVFQEGEQLRNQGTTESLRQAIQKYEEVLQLVKVLGDRQWEANTLNYIGLIYNNLGEKQKALESFLQALPLVRTLGIQEGEASILTSIGAIYNELGKKQEAINYLHQALPLRRALRDPDGEAATLNNLGRLYYSLGENRQALDYYTQALPLRQAAKNRAGEAGILSSIGDVYVVLSEKQKAVENYTQALLIWQDLGEEKGKANTLNSLGNLYSSLNEAQKALDYYNQALLLYQKLGERKGETAALNNIGSVYLFLGEAQKSLDYLNQVLPIVREFGDRNAEAKILSNMGSNYATLNEDQKAIDYYIQALRLFQSVDDKEGEAITLIKIGTTLGVSSSDISQKQQGLDYLKRALLITRDIRARSTEATALHGIGNVYYNLGDKQKALEYYAQALSIRRAIEDREPEAITLTNIAAVKQFQGNFKEALADIEAAAKIVESLRTKIINSDLRTSYFATNQIIYRRYVDILMAMHRQNPNAGHDIAAFEVSERARARSLIELLNEARADIPPGVDPELGKKERQLKQQLRARIQYQLELFKSQPTEEQKEAIRKQIADIQTQLQEVEAQIRVKNPRYGALTQPLTLKEIQKQVIDAESILLVYWLGEERSYLWAITPTTINTYVLPKRAEIEAASEQFTNFLINASLTRTRPIKAAAATATLSQMVLKPVAGELGQKRLVIVSDGVLQSIPFSALSAPQASSDNEIKPLVVEHEIVNLPSASTLALIRRDLAQRQPAPKALAVIANPVYSAKDPRVRGNSPVAKPGTPQVAQVVDGLSSSSAGLFAPLPWTQQEAEKILALVPESDRLQAFDFDASRETATSSQLSQYRILHFATHGFINTLHPEQSGIALSLVNQQGKGQDGLLLTPDIFNLTWPAELVVLSGCQTGLGKEIKGEGLVGLTRGLMYAGASRVMVSLWLVNDKSTAELMTRFYQGMLQQKLSPAAALRALQISMWQEKREPYYWAAFILQGEWQ